MNKLVYHLVAFWVVAVWGTTFIFTKLLLMAGLTAAHIFVLRFIIAYVLLKKRGEKLQKAAEAKAAEQASQTAEEEQNNG